MGTFRDLDFPVVVVSTVLRSSCEMRILRCHNEVRLQMLADAQSFNQDMLFCVLLVSTTDLMIVPFFAQ